MGNLERSQKLTDVIERWAEALRGATMLEANEARDAVRAELLEVDRLEAQLEGAVAALQEAADYLRHDEPDAAAVIIERACEVLGVDLSTGGGQ
jgi:hypothetical protein